MYMDICVFEEIERDRQRGGNSCTSFVPSLFIHIDERREGYVVNIWFVNKLKVVFNFSDLTTHVVIITISRLRD